VVVAVALAVSRQPLGYLLVALYVLETFKAREGKSKRLTKGSFRTSKLALERLVHIKMDISGLRRA
jgi:hypothetical protein